MSFQNLPWLWATVALIALPVVIHLINQYRHRTVKWAAMMFLLDAKRMTSGMARLRQVLILLMRTLAVAGLIFAVARPLASGWLALAAGGAPETIIVVLDRSASMEQQNPQTGLSKREAALEKLTEFLATTGKGTGTQLVLIENAENTAREVDSLDVLRSLPETSATATSADIPAMLRTALDYTTTNLNGRTDIWLCSDQRGSDWDPGGGRWEALQTAFAERELVKFFLLSFDEITADNLSVSVTQAVRRTVGDAAELMLDVRLTRALPTPLKNADAAGGADLPEQRLPLSIVIDGVRSVHEVTLAEGQAEFVLQGHTISLDRSQQSGWGWVEIPGDSNLLDNQAAFVFAEPLARLTMVVSDDADSAAPLQAAAGAPLDPTVAHRAMVVASDEASVAEIDWQNSALVLWQGAVPTADSITGRQLQDFLSEGKNIIFFPSSSLGDDAGSNSLEPAFGLRWGQWRDASDEGGAKVSNWRRDSDLLADTQDGSALPLGELRVYRWRELELPAEAVEPTVLARMAENAAPLLLKISHPFEGDSGRLQQAGSVYVCQTLPQASHSNLARDGVTLFAMLHRVIESGAHAMLGANQRTCGSGALPADENWRPISESDDGRQLAAGMMPMAQTSNERALLPGIFFREVTDTEVNDVRRLIALNRPVSEDDPSVLDGDNLATLFSGLDYEQIALTVDDQRSLVSEVWRAFLIAMALALILEAALCLPKQRSPTITEPSGLSGFGDRTEAGGSLS